MHYQIEAMRHAYVDRNSYLGDPDFVKNPVDGCSTRGYAAKIRAAIDPKKAGDLRGHQAGRRAARRQQHDALLDRRQWGNAVSVTYTLNDWFGAKVTAPGTGVLLNNEMDDFTPRSACPTYGLVQGEANAIAPGKRPLSSMSPTIVTKDGKPVMVVGTPGGSRIITAVLQTILNVVDYEMDMQEAVDAPRFHQQWLPDVTNVETFALSPDTRKMLESMGHRFENRSRPITWRRSWSARPAWRKAGGQNRFYGANDPRRNTGLALGY